MKKPSLTRRDFIKRSAIASSSLLIPMPAKALESITKENSNRQEPRVYLFSKHLQFLNYDDMAEAAAEIGFDGVDLTVRPNGHVLPERVTDDLPKAVEAMKKFSLLPQMMTTNITDAANAEHKSVLVTASQLGLKYYRMGWLSYPEERTISESIETYSQQFETLESVNKKLGLHGGYQNHAGNHVGAPIWDLYQLLKDRSSNHIGSQYDIRHAVVEGGSSWELGLRLIHPFINSIVIKDFKWGKSNGKWKPINTPLGEGMVDFKRYFSLLKKYNIDVPVSLHLEYDLGGAEHGASEINVDRTIIFAHMKKDLNFLRKTWKDA